MCGCWSSSSLVSVVHGHGDWLVHLLCLCIAAVVDPEDYDDSCHAAGGFLRITMDCAMPVVMTVATVIGAADDFGLENSSEGEVESTESCCDG